MTLITGTDRHSSCVYCNQQTYGTGCPYSPHRVHVHIDDPKRCIYCGQQLFGQGCPYNPTSRIHVHGVEFNQMIKESIEKTLTTQLFIQRLTEPINESGAFKLGLIDEQGRRLKLPESPKEKKALTPLDVYIFRIKRMMGEDKLALLNSSLVLETLGKNRDTKFDQKLYESQSKVRVQIQNLVQDYKNIIFEATQNGVTFSQIEDMFVEEICEIPGS